MSANFKTQFLIVISALLPAQSVLLAQVPGAAPPPPPTAVGNGPAIVDPQVLEAGPIHEAFAEPIALEQQAALIIPQEPPASINELPPEEQPAGRNIVWIPGYWSWDPDRNDYLWVSGLWRDVPPGRRWIPGEWLEVDGGFQWTPGFWAGDEQVRFLPAPPASLEQGPSSPAPGENFLWAPGCWQFIGSGYAWQTGYWYQANPNWIWIPGHYTYTPRGSIYVSGYWDYPLASRGLLYAPVYWGARHRPFVHTYAYRPTSIVNSALLIANLVVDHHHVHYHYGYGRHGKVPHWLHAWGNGYDRWGGHYKKHHRGYDPLWAVHHNNIHKPKKVSRIGFGPQGKKLVVDSRKLDRRSRENLKLHHVSKEQYRKHRDQADFYRGKNRKEILAREEYRGKPKPSQRDYVVRGQDDRTRERDFNRGDKRSDFQRRDTEAVVRKDSRNGSPNRDTIRRDDRTRDRSSTDERVVVRRTDVENQQANQHAQRVQGQVVQRQSSQSSEASDRSRRISEYMRRTNSNSERARTGSSQADQSANARRQQTFWQMLQQRDQTQQASNRTRQQPETIERMRNSSNSRNRMADYQSNRRNTGAQPEQRAQILRAQAEQIQRSRQQNARSNSASTRNRNQSSNQRAQVQRSQLTQRIQAQRSQQPQQRVQNSRQAQPRSESSQANRSRTRSSGSSDAQSGRKRKNR